MCLASDLNFFNYLLADRPLFWGREPYVNSELVEIVEARAGVVHEEALHPEVCLLEFLGSFVFKFNSGRIVIGSLPSVPLPTPFPAFWIADNGANFEVHQLVDATPFRHYWMTRNDNLSDQLRSLGP